MDSYAELREVLGQDSELELHSIGLCNLGTHNKPDRRFGVMFLTRNNVSAQGRVWAFVPVDPSLLDEEPEIVSKWLLESAHEAVSAAVAQEAS